MKTPYRIIITALILLSSVAGFSQTMPLTSQFYLNRYLYNPAFAGATPEIKGLLMYRQDWAQFNDAPTSMLASFQMPFKEQKFGLGAYIHRNTFGPQAYTGGQVSYAYHMRLRDELLVSLGLGVNVWNSSLDFSYFGDNVNDPLILGQQESSTSFDGTGGVNIQTQNFFMSFSVQNLLETSNKFDNTSDLPAVYQDNARQYYWMTGFNIPIKDSVIDFEPALLIKYTAANSPQADLNARFIYKDFLWAGLSYRAKSALVYGVGFKIKESIELGYAYDNPLTDLGSYGGSHEIVLRYRHSLIKKPEDTLILATDIYDTASIDTLIALDTPIVDPSDTVAVLPADTMVNAQVDTPVVEPEVVEIPVDTGGVAAAEEAEIKPEEPEKVDPPKVEEPEVADATPKTIPDKPIKEDVPKADPPKVETITYQNNKIERYNDSNPYKYVVAGSFSNPDNALEFKNQMVAKGYDAKVIEHKARGFYRVSLYQSLDSLDADKKVQKYRKDLNNPYIWMLENKSYNSNVKKLEKKEEKAEKEAKQQPVIKRTTTVKTEKVGSTDVEVLDNTNKFYHVIVGSFGSFSNATKLQADLKAKGYDSKILLDKDRNLYRVGLYSTLDAAEARERLKEYQAKVDPKIWLLKK